MAEVRSKTGAATASDFSGSTGTPIVVDQTTGDIAVLKTGDTVFIVGSDKALLAGSASQTFSVAAATAAAHAVRLDQLSVDLTTLPIYSQGSFTATLVGCTTSPTQTWKWVKVGSMVTITPPNTVISGTSNSTGKSFTGLPASLYPATSIATFCQASDNGGAYTVGLFTISAAGVIAVYKDANGSNWTASGTSSIVGNIFSYCL